MKRLFCLVLLLLVCLPVAAKRTDWVGLNTGNRIQGEIKLLERGLLEYSVTGVGSRLKIRWSRVDTLTSNKLLEIDLRGGAYYLGSLIEASEPGRLRILTAGKQEIEVRVPQVVKIQPVKQDFLARFDSRIGTGFSLVKATDVVQFNFSFSTIYRTERNTTNYSLSTLLTTKRGGSTRNNSDSSIDHFLSLKKQWFLRGVLSANRNDELGNNLRTGGALGGGRWIYFSPVSLLQISGLFNVNREWRDDDDDQVNIELVLDTGYEIFDYDLPKLEFAVDLRWFVNLTSWGRVRVDLNSTLSMEIVRRLYWDISQLYFRYDKDPADGANSRHDYALVSGLRYRF